MSEQTQTVRDILAEEIQGCHGSSERRVVAGFVLDALEGWDGTAAELAEALAHAAADLAKRLDAAEGFPGARGTRHAYRYRLSTGDGLVPLHECQECGRPLRLARAVEVTWSDGGHYWNEYTRLDEHGLLVDPQDNVGRGLHAGTRCAHCSALLIDHDDVLEDLI